MAELWNRQVEEVQRELEKDPFSAHFNPEAHVKSRPSPGEEGYGFAPAGSASEKRAQKSQAWVEREIESLLQAIARLGGRREGGLVAGRQCTYEIRFGELFAAYADVSDSLVGILLRAQKRGLLQFESVDGTLLQRRDDHVLIRTVSEQEHSGLGSLDRMHQPHF